MVETRRPWPAALPADVDGDRVAAVTGDDRSAPLAARRGVSDGG